MVESAQRDKNNYRPKGLDCNILNRFKLFFIVPVTHNHNHRSLLPFDRNLLLPFPSFLPLLSFSSLLFFLWKSYPPHHRSSLRSSPPSSSPFFFFTYKSPLSPTKPFLSVWISTLKSKFVQDQSFSSLDQSSSSSH